MRGDLRGRSTGSGTAVLGVTVQLGRARDARLGFGVKSPGKPRVFEHFRVRRGTTAQRENERTYAREAFAQGLDREEHRVGHALACRKRMNERLRTARQGRIG